MMSSAFRFGVAALAAGGIALCAGSARGQTIVQGPVVNPANGSKYYVVQAADWNAARAFAATLCGSLATVEDSAENAWIGANLTNGGSLKLFLGLHAPAPAPANQASSYVWDDGSSSTYRNWNPGEPGLGGGAYVQLRPDVGFTWGAVGVAYTPYSVVEVKGVLRVPQDYATIQSAINAAQSGSTIIVGPGTHTGPIDFLGKRLTVRSIAGALGTTISGGSSPGVRFTGGEPAGTLLEGFTIQGYSGVSSAAMVINNNAAPTIRGCIVRGNSSTSGAAFVVNGAMPRFESCRFVGNSGTSGSGGTINSSGGAGTVMINCVTTSNSGTAACGLRVAASNLAIRNCTFAGNSCFDSVLIADASTVSIYNSILGNGIAITSVNGAPSLDVRYCCVTGGFAGDGNINADPLFRGNCPPTLTGETDYALAPGSPCIDAGNRGLYLPPFTAGGSLVDAAGQPRIVQDRASADTGPGRPPIDMGAYEFQTGEFPCAGDIDGDGGITIDDLFLYLNIYFTGC